jgi:hypothetical protein
MIARDPDDIFIIEDAAGEPKGAWICYGRHILIPAA